MTANSARPVIVTNDQKVACPEASFPDWLTVKGPASGAPVDPHTERDASRPPDTLPLGRTEPAPEVSVARVMVVDDMADIRELLRDFLELEGYTVEAVGNATDALIRLAEFRPGVILLDILMPGLSGISALQRIHGIHPEVGVIMVTGIGNEEIAKRALSLGAFDYVTKPIDFAYLTRVLETWLLMRPLEGYSWRGV